MTAQTPSKVGVHPHPRLLPGPDLSSLSLVTTAEAAEEVLDFGWDVGVGGGGCGAGGEDGRSQGSQGGDDLLDAQPGALLSFAGDGQGGQHDGQVSVDAVALVVEDRLCRPPGYADPGGEGAGQRLGSGREVGIVRGC